MKRYDRTWPTAVVSIGLGVLVSSLLYPSRTQQRTYTTDQPVEWEAHTERRVGHEVAVVRYQDLAERFQNEFESFEPDIAYVLETQELLDMLRYSPRELERMQAAVQLGNKVDERDAVLGALMIAVHSDAYTPVRIKAAEALGKLGGEFVLGPLVVAANSDAEPEVREMATRWLGQIENPEATRPLVDVLFTDQNVDVRVQAALSLGLVGTNEARGALRSSKRSDASEAVRRAADQALVLIEFQRQAGVGN